MLHRDSGIRRIVAVVIFLVTDFCRNDVAVHSVAAILAQKQGKRIPPLGTLELRPLNEKVGKRMAPQIQDLYQP